MYSLGCWLCAQLDHVYSVETKNGSTTIQEIHKGYMQSLVSAEKLYRIKKKPL